MERLAQALTASQKGRSYVIGVSVRTSDPDLSAEIANALAKAYINDQLLAKSDATSRATGWLKRIASVVRYIEPTGFRSPTTR